MLADGDEEKLRFWVEETEVVLGKLGLAVDWAPPNRCLDILEIRAAGLEVGVALSRWWGISPTTAPAALRNAIE